MATKKRYFVDGSYYHIFNRGVEKRKVFLKDRDYEKFLETLKHCLENSSKPSRKLVGEKPELAESPVDIVAFCLMPNHFHFLIKQVSENGVSRFLSRLTNSYTKYFNTKYDRVGPLFQGSFRSVTLESNDQLLHLSRYIHLNPVVSGLSKVPQDYNWSSYLYYMKAGSAVGVIVPDIILDQFASREDYLGFVNDQIDYVKQLEEIKHLSLDE